jgi:hypothetical protein
MPSPSQHPGYRAVVTEGHGVGDARSVFAHHPLDPQIPLQLLGILHPFLQQQRRDYQVFVVEQDGDPNKPFNKGKLFNVAFLAVDRLRPEISCFILHDVDLVPEDERMLYR